MQVRNWALLASNLLSLLAGAGRSFSGSCHPVASCRPLAGCDQMGPPPRGCSGKQMSVFWGFWVKVWRRRRQPSWHFCAHTSGRERTGKNYFVGKCKGCEQVLSRVRFIANVSAISHTFCQVPCKKMFQKFAFVFLPFSMFFIKKTPSFSIKNDSSIT